MEPFRFPRKFDHKSKSIWGLRKSWSQKSKINLKSSFGAKRAEKWSHSEFHENLTISQYQYGDYENQGSESQKLI